MRESDVLEARRLTMRIISLLTLGFIGLAALLLIAAPGSTGIGAAMQDPTPSGPTDGPGPSGGPSTGMPLLQNEDIAVSALNALDARFYAEDAVLHDLATLESYEGPEAIDAALATLFRDRYPDIRFQRVHVTALPNAPVVMELHACFTGVEDCTTYVPLVWIFEIEEQQIIESRLYYNPALFPAEDDEDA
jgi:ketosteroid isomerase-like protein